MPELPETETIARDLDAMVRGARVVGVTVHRPDVVREVAPDAMAALLQGRTIGRVWRRAKLVVLTLDHASGPLFLVVQPRFTGALLVREAQPPTDGLESYHCVTWALEDGRQLVYRDVRRLGTVAVMDADRFAAYSGALGPEPLDPDLTAEAFSASVRYSRQSVKVALMDQRKLAGVGNIYANEALWHAGIDPSRAGSSLSAAEAEALWRALRSVLTAAIAARGTSFRDYRDARGGKGGFVEQLVAYGRAGLPCPRCGRRLVGTHAVDGRSTVFCPRCQH